MDAISWGIGVLVAVVLLIAIAMLFVISRLFRKVEQGKALISHRGGRCPGRPGGDGRTARCRPAPDTYGVRHT